MLVGTMWFGQFRKVRALLFAPQVCQTASAAPRGRLASLPSASAPPVCQTASAHRASTPRPSKSPMLAACRGALSTMESRSPSSILPHLWPTSPSGAYGGEVYRRRPASTVSLPGAPSSVRAVRLRAERGHVGRPGATKKCARRPAAWAHLRCSLGCPRGAPDNFLNPSAKRASATVGCAAGSLSGLPRHRANKRGPPNDLPRSWSATGPKGRRREDRVKANASTACDHQLSFVDDRRCSPRHSGPVPHRRGGCEPDRDSAGHGD